MKNLNNNNNSLKNIEIHPPEVVWDNIERELQKKKNRKVIPFWFKFSGAAAVLLIGIFLGKQYSNQSIKTNIDKNNIVVESFGNNKYKISIDNKSKNQNVKESEIHEIKKYVNNQKSNLITSKNPTNNISETSINFKQKPIARNKSRQISSANDQSENVLIENNSKLINNLIENKTTTTAQTNLDIDLKNKNINPENSIHISENLTLAESKKDSDSKKINELEILLAEKTTKKPNLQKSNKWQIMPNLAPVYANSTSNNSPIDAKFNNNQKSYDKNISFGLAVNYSLNKKFAIRSGINHFSVGYNTNEIGFYSSKNANVKTTIANINQVDNSNNLTVLSNVTDLESTLQVDNISSYANNNNNEKIQSGVLTQQTSYIEVPVEISYSVIDKKIGINLIAGVSTFFLNKNQITIQSAVSSLDLGQSNNLSKIHYSSNIGLGLSYKFAKSFKINLEPIFKYQINTFTNDVGNYKPYFVGVYSGISFGF